MRDILLLLGRTGGRLPRVLSILAIAGPLAFSIREEGEYISHWKPYECWLVHAALFLSVDIIRCNLLPRFPDRQHRSRMLLVFCRGAAVESDVRGDWGVGGRNKA